MSAIVLSTINARYIHASLGLRYLMANMGELQNCTQIKEFTLEQRPEDIVEQLLSMQPKIIGFGTYIWNVLQTTEVIKLIKIISPDTKIIVGGPEVSYETAQQEIAKLADVVIQGASDLQFSEVCNELLAGKSPGNYPIGALPFQLETLQSPYPFYSDEDIANRVIYVEASRGCPFKCEFCLSSLDKTASPFPLEQFLDDMQSLIDRGATQFKFVDRTFNLKASTSEKILRFFLQQIHRPLFLHFELIPDRLPTVMHDLLPQFPKNSLQFEIGIQSFNPDVQKNISRKQDHEKTCENLTWLRQHTEAHIHADLIFGLPGEDIESFGKGFDLLFSLGPQEIQVGILKRLRGTPIERHTKEFDMRYMSTPPYRILSNKHADFDTVQRMVRFARYWDLIGNSGRFPHLLPLILQANPFKNFLSLSDWLFSTTQQTHKIALARLFELLYGYLSSNTSTPTDVLQNSTMADYQHNRLKGQPRFLHKLTDTSYLPLNLKNQQTQRATEGNAVSTGSSRQRRHI